MDLAERKSFMARVECVIFDLGKVLVDWDLSTGLWPEMKEIFGPPGQRTPIGSKWEILYDQYARGLVAPKYFHHELMNLLGMDLTYDDFVGLWCDIFHPMNGMAKLFAEVGDRIAVGLLSDTDPLHWAYILESYPWLQRIEKPTLSFEIGTLKPDKRSYLQAASNMGFDADKCFFTDDLEKNIQGALACGMDAVRFEGCDALRTELVKRNIITA